MDTKALLLLLCAAHVVSIPGQDVHGMSHIEQKGGPLGDVGPESTMGRAMKLVAGQDLSWEGWFDAGALILQARISTDFLNS